MKHRLKQLMTLALCAMLGALCAGCAAVPFLAAQVAEDIARPRSAPATATPAPTASPVPDPDAIYGSVGLLGREPVTLVSVYLDDSSGAGWTVEGIAATQDKIAMAVEWLNVQCAAYGVDAQITWADAEHEDLLLTATYDGEFWGGENAEEETNFYDAADMFCADEDTAAFRARYGSNVGFLFFLPVSGVDHTMVHYIEDGAAYFYEYCCLYQYDAYADMAFTPDSPAAYAHEILHLFGAPDLYEDSPDAAVTAELVAAVREKWPDEIMYDTYDPDGSIRYDRILQSIGPVSAYFLGLADSFDGMENYPLVSKLTPGTFTDNLGGERAWGGESWVPSATALPQPRETPVAV